MQILIELSEDERQEAIKLLSAWVIKNTPGCKTEDFSPMRFMAVTAMLFGLKGVKGEQVAIGKEEVGGPAKF